MEVAIADGKVVLGVVDLNSASWNHNVSWLRGG